LSNFFVVGVNPGTYKKSKNHETYKENKKIFAGKLRKVLKSNKKEKTGKALDFLLKVLNHLKLA